MAKTRIIVLKLKKLLRIGIPAALVVVLLFLFFALFVSPKNDNTGNGENVTPTVATYHAGVYNSVIELGDSFLNLEVVVDTDHINSVRLVNLDDATAAMYPLMEPALESLSDQIQESQSLDHLSYSEESQYTSMMLIDAIQTALNKAKN